MSLYGDNQLKLAEYFSKNNNNETNLSAVIGFFNVRGWEEINKIGNFKNSRILLGMPMNDIESINKQLTDPEFNQIIDDSLAEEISANYIDKISNQLQIGAPSFSEKEILRKLLDEIDQGNVSIKIYTETRLHAKVYILTDKDNSNALLGSSNLTYSGINATGELNTDLSSKDSQDALNWFNEKWNSRFAIDITLKLKEVISNSWASDEIISPFDLYLKFLYLLSKDAREGMVEYAIPKIIEKDLLEYQKNAVEISTKYLQKQSGIMIGDAVGFGKTIEAIGIAGLLQNQFGFGTLVICPPNLIDMWEKYLDRYEIFGSKVIPMSSKTKKILPELKRYHLVIIDESHNLRTGKRQEYNLIKEYISLNESKVVLLTATPFNKDFSDVFNQIKLFQNPEEDIGYKPEYALSQMETIEISNISDGKLSTLDFFEKALAKYPNDDDMQIFMSNYLIRRTRKFLADNYAKIDESTKKSYFIFADGSKHYIPTRIPKSIPIERDLLGSSQKRLRDASTVDEIDNLNLPRYKLKDYLVDNVNIAKILDLELKTFIEGVLKLGNNVYSFNKTFLYKRLSSSEYAFVVSAKRRVNSDKFWIWCIENHKEIPTGSIDNETLEDIDENEIGLNIEDSRDYTEIYDEIYYNQPSWVRAWVPIEYFKIEELKRDLLKDVETLESLLSLVQDSNLEDDAKVDLLIKYLKNDLNNQKVLIFSEFADTVEYVYKKLIKSLPDKKIEAITSSSKNILEIASRFSPKSNNYNLENNEENIEILISTDVLSEGQNLQDSSIVVNYDLPWTIIKIIQRAGRIDRIGQKSETVSIYTFEPDEGIENVINLRGRIRDRLNKNSVVFGSDEKFFGDELESNAIENFYTGNMEVLDELEAEGVEVDIISEAHSRWLKAVQEFPERTEKVKKLPNLIYSSRSKNSENTEIVTYFQSNQRDIFIQSFNSNKTEEIEFKRITPRAALTIFESRPEDKGYEIKKTMLEIVRESYLKMNKLSREEFKGSLSGYRKKLYNILKKNVDSLIDIEPEIKNYIQLIYDEPLSSYAKNYLKPFLQKPNAENVLSAIKQLIEINQLTTSFKNSSDKTKVILSLQK